MNYEYGWISVNIAISLENCTPRQVQGIYKDLEMSGLLTAESSQEEFEKKRTLRGESMSLERSKETFRIIEKHVPCP